jgi:multidrug efflux pump subunit AcrB
MASIIALGTLSFIALPRELSSEISFNWAFVAVPYPGVSSEEIERLVTVPLEDEIQDVRGIDSITSQSAEGRSFLSVKFKQMSDEEFRARFQDLRTELDKVTLPEDALDMIVMNFTSSDLFPVIAVNLHGKVGEKQLNKLAEELKDRLMNISGVSKLEMIGDREREIWVQADPIKLEGYQISLGMIQAAIAAQGVNIPGGSLSLGRQEVLVRILGEFETAEQIRKVIVRSTPTGQAIRVEDLAEVTETFEEAETINRLDLEPVISMNISKKKEASSMAVTEEIKKVSEEFVRKSGNQVRVTFSQDSSEMIDDILTKLSRNAWTGFIIVVMVLMLVLGFRNAILAALGIPLSFLACFIFLHRSGGSFNGNSLFGLVLVLGIIVDDAIIIVENCFRHRQLGKSWSQAAIDGTQEVMAPVLSATGTTIAVFLPLMLMPGIVGKFMSIIPITVSLALLASMIEAFVILPSHFADWPGRKDIVAKEPLWLQDLRQAYLPVLKWVIKKRYLVALVFVPLLVVGALSCIPLVGVDMFAAEEISSFQVRLRMPNGTNLKASSQIVSQFETRARLLPNEEIRSVRAAAGFLMTDEDWIFRTDVAELWIDLVPSYDRKRSLDQIMEDLRGKVANISGPVSVKFAKINTGPPVGKPVEVKVKGKYIDSLEQVADELKGVLTKMKGLREIDDDFRPGTQEIRLRVDPAKAAMFQLSVGQVGQAVRSAIYGITADTMTDADEEIDVVVRVNKNYFSRHEDLLRLPILTPMGKTIFLRQVAEFSIQPGYAEIRRYKQERAITVSASIDEEQTDVMAVNQEVEDKFENLAKRHPGVSLDFSGEFQEFKESFASIAQLFLFGIFLVYLILGTQFRSYLQPLVIIGTVPLAFIGAILGLLVSGNPFSIGTLFGIVALAGVAVNDAIVLVSFINQRKKEGKEPLQAVIEAAGMRLRPILLTSITTIAGLVPMAVGLGGMSLTWAPFANTIVWGLAVATLMTIFLIPAAYVIVVEDISSRFTRKTKPE